MNVQFRNTTGICLRKLINKLMIHIMLSRGGVVHEKNQLVKYHIFPAAFLRTVISLLGDSPNILVYSRLKWDRLS